MKTTGGFTQKPTTSASAAFLLVVSILLNNISELAVTASLPSSSDHLINLEEGRKQCSADGKTIKKLFDEYLVPVLDKYAERFPWTQQMAFYGTDKNNQVIDWNWVVRFYYFVLLIIFSSFNSYALFITLLAVSDPFFHLT